MSKLKAFLSVFAVIITFGCTSADYTVHFKDELILDYASNDSPLSLIEKIGNKKISREDIHDNSIIVDNFKISCEPIDTMEEKTYNVIFYTSDTENQQYEIQVTVKDISSPTISLKKNNLIFKMSEIKTVAIEDYITVIDNKDEKPIVTMSNYNLDSPGTYTITISAEDLEGNISTEEIKITITDDKKKEEDKTNSGQNSPASKNDSVNNKKPSGSSQNSQEKKPSGNSQNSQKKKEETSSKNLKTKTFYFGKTYRNELTGKNVYCDMSTATDLSRAYLKASGKSGECIPVMKDGVYIGMKVIIY